MKQAKFILIAAGVLGLLACFLPYVKEGPISMSLWDFHKMPAGNSGLINGPKQAYVAIVTFGLTGVMGVLALKQLLRWHGIVAAVMCLLTFSLEAVRKGLSGDHGMHTAIGGKLLFIAALVGLVGGIIAAAKPEA